MASYAALAQNDPNLPTVLNQIIAAPSHSDKQRVELISLILDDLKHDSPRKIPDQHVPRALLAVKTLGRTPVGSKAIMEEPRLAVLRAVVDNGPPQATLEALKCIANAMLLLPAARETWATLDGGESSLRVLESTHAPESIFIASRILFLLTAQEAPVVRALVDDRNAVHVVCTAFEPALKAYLAGAPSATEALMDLLKIPFNLILHYPRMIARARGDTVSALLGDLWDDRLASFVPVLVRALHAVPQDTARPLAAPLSHVVHALIGVPVAPFAPLFLCPGGPAGPSTRPAVASGNAKLLAPLHSAITRLHRRSRADTPPAADALPPPSSSRSPPSRPASPAGVDDAAGRALALLDAALARYLPGTVDPDDATVRAAAAADSIALADALPPFLILPTRLATGSAPARARLRAALLPPDLDRSTALEERADLLGRLLRLMRCVYFERAKDAAGALLFSVCDSDANTLSAQIGYGNAAGFLYNHAGLGGALPTAPTGRVEDVDDGDGDGAPTINPITGMRTDGDAPDPLADMTDEEKEREAERLFVLFDRLERTGMGVTNPFRQAFRDGKMQYP